MLKYFFLNIFPAHYLLCISMQTCFFTALYCKHSVKNFYAKIKQLSSVSWYLMFFYQGQSVIQTIHNCYDFLVVDLSDRSQHLMQFGLIVFFTVIGQNKKIFCIHYSYLNYTYGSNYFIVYHLQSLFFHTSKLVEF